MLAALVAVLALGALASASASAALPEFKYYKVNEKITGSGGEVEITEAGDAKYFCQSSAFTGVIVGPKELGKVVLSFNCSKSQNYWCMKKVGKNDEFVTNELKARIAYISKETKEVGLLLEPTTQPFASGYEDGGFEVEVKGSLLGVISNRESPFALTYKGGSEGEQLFEKFEGEEVKHHLERLNLNGGKALDAAIDAAMTLKPEKEKWELRS